MDKYKLKDFSKKCPYQLGDCVSIIKYRLPSITLPIKIQKDIVCEQKITDIEIIQSKFSEKATFVYKLGNDKKYYRLKRIVGDEGNLVNEKVKISLKKVKMWPYLPNYKKCG